MKKLIFIASALMFNTTIMKAQITLDYSNDSVTFAGDFYCTDIGNNDFKYVLIDYKANSFSLYNMDMTPFMTDIFIPPIADSIAQGYTVIYVTKTLFDCDSTNIEYVYERPYGGGNKDPFRVFRTDGTLLFQVDSAVAPFADGFYGGSLVIRPVINTSAGAKLFLSKYNAQWGSGIQIYSLCGELPLGMYDFSDNNKMFVKIFPNPADNELNFEIMPPNNLDEFEILIYDGNATERKKINASRMQNRFSLDLSDFSSGAYFFSLISNNKVYQTGKFILTK